jgi:hypothetical protein
VVSFCLLKPCVVSFSNSQVVTIASHDLVVEKVTQASASTAGRIGAALLHALGDQSGIARTRNE